MTLRDAACQAGWHHIQPWAYERDIFDKMVPDGYIVYRCGNCGQVFRKEAGA